MKKRHVSEQAWKRAAVWATVIFVVMQVVTVVLGYGIRQYPDALSYMILAYRSMGVDQWYPTTYDEYSRFIFAPGFVNFLLLQLKLFGTFNLNAVFNMLMSMAMMGEVYALAHRFFNRRTAYVAVVLFALLYSNYAGVVVNGTEIPFLFTSLTAFWLLVRFPRHGVVAAGVLFAVSQTVRPLAMLFVAAALVYLFLQRSRWWQHVALVVSFAAVLAVVGLVNQHRMGYCVYQSTTGGVNLVMTAADNADGLTSTFLRNGVGPGSARYIKNARHYTFVQRDSIWKARAVDWIKRHPAKYISFFPKKWAVLFVDDTWADRLIRGHGMTSSLRSQRLSVQAKVWLVAEMLLKSITYYAVCVLFVVQLWRGARRVIRSRSHARALFTDSRHAGKVALLFLFFAGVLATSIFAVGPRYHYPFLFIMVIWAAYALERATLRR